MPMKKIAGVLLFGVVLASCIAIVPGSSVAQGSAHRNDLSRFICG